MTKNAVVRHLLWIEKNCDVEAWLRALRRNAFLILAPFIVACIVSAFWYFVIWKFGFYCSVDAAQQHGTAVNVLFIIFAMPAALVLIDSLNRYRVISAAAWEHDKIAFMRTRDQALPVKMHILFGIMGLAGLIVLMLGGYPSVGSGLKAVFSSWFAMTAYFIVALQLQNPATSEWFRIEVPPDWLTDNPKEYLTKVGVIKIPGCVKVSA